LSDLKPAPRFASSSSTLSKSLVERASRSRRVDEDSGPADDDPARSLAAALQGTRCGRQAL